MFRDPLLLSVLALFTAFVLGRASARSTWRRIREERLYLADFQAVAERWRQREAPLVPDWPTVLPAGGGVRELTTRAAATEPVPAGDSGPVRWPVAVGRHRRHIWVGFWAASATPRDPGGFWAAIQRADSVTGQVDSVQRRARPPMRYVEITDAEPVRELVGAST